MDATLGVFTRSTQSFGPIMAERADVVTTNTSVAASITQQIGFVTYGLGSHIDASLAVPFVIADLSVTSDATIRRLGTGANTIVHYYDDGSGNRGTSRQYVRTGRAKASAT